MRFLEDEDEEVEADVEEEVSVMPMPSLHRLSRSLQDRSRCRGSSPPSEDANTPHSFRSVICTLPDFSNLYRIGKGVPHTAE